MNAIKLHIITGQTASGKSAVARRIARFLATEIICVDSMKIYRGMDIGTAKDAPPDLKLHLVDIAEPSEDFSVARFVELADKAIEDVAGRGLPVLLEGGTPLYIKALTEGLFSGPDCDHALRSELGARLKTEGPEALHEELKNVDPEAANRISPGDARRIIRALEVYRKTGEKISKLQTQFGGMRPRYERKIVALRHDRARLRERIDRRIEEMFEKGFVGEVGRLLAEGLGRTASQAIGYKEVACHLAGGISLEDAKKEIRRRTWRLARRQMTWLRSFPDIVFYDIKPEKSAGEVAADVGRLLGLTE